MPDTLKITLAQLNQSVGDLGANARAVLDARTRAGDSDLVVFPELHLIGYPPEDLVLRPSLIERAAAELQILAEATGDNGPALLVGSAFVLDGALHNGVALLERGKVAAVRLKHELPNYGTFDEARLFHPGPLPEPVIVRGTMIGVPIGEDIWRPEVCRHLANFGASMFVCVNGSPYEMEKDSLRIEGVAKRRAVDTGLPLAYLNRVGGQDELVFDGASFVVNGDGALAAQLADWQEQELTTRWTRTATGWRCDRSEISPLVHHPEDLWCAMTLALRDYVTRNGYSGVTLTLTDDLASAVAAIIAVDALGSGQVRALTMPGPGADAGNSRDCASALGIALEEIEIEAAVEPAGRVLVANDRANASTARRDLAARMRALALMDRAGADGSMPLAFADKTSIALGLALAQGGMAGAYSPLKDVYRTTLVELARWRNANVPKIGKGPGCAPIPAAMLANADDAVPGGKAGDTHAALPPYRVLDPVLAGLVEQDKCVDQLVAEGFEKATVAHVETLLHAAELERRLAPPGVKLTSRNFGRDRRYPLTHAYRSG